MSSDLIHPACYVCHTLRHVVCVSITRIVVLQMIAPQPVSPYVCSKLACGDFLVGLIIAFIPYVVLL
jgi:hypothetical protein